MINPALIEPEVGFLIIVSHGNNFNMHSRNMLTDPCSRDRVVYATVSATTHESTKHRQRSYCSLPLFSMSVERERPNGRQLQICARWWGVLLSPRPTVPFALPCTEYKSSYQREVKSYHSRHAFAISIPRSSFSCPQPLQHVGSSSSNGAEWPYKRNSKQPTHTNELHSSTLGDSTSSAALLPKSAEYAPRTQQTQCERLQLGRPARSLRGSFSKFRSQLCVKQSVEWPFFDHARWSSSANHRTLGGADQVAQGV